LVCDSNQNHGTVIKIKPSEESLKQGRNRSWLLFKTHPMCLDRYAKTYQKLKDQIMKNNRENPIIYTNILIDLIEQRRQAMTQRFNRIRQYHLKTFFDQAPAVHLN
ncbi:unnamed protein product, partial [Rotaria socialis]